MSRDYGDRGIHRVVVNERETFSIWPADREPPPGWQEAGMTGTIQECLGYLQEVWAELGPRCLRTEFVEPRTPIEEELAALWQEFLGLEQVGIHHSFFSLGGHSLRTAEVVARVRDLFGVEIPLQFIFEQPTIAGLAQEITRRREEG